MIKEEKVKLTQDSYTLSIRFPEAAYKRLRTLAELEELSVAATVRLALKRLESETK